MGAEVVHEEVVRIVHKEVKGVYHLSVIANQGHLNRLLDNFRYILLRSLLFLKQFNLHLLFGLFYQELCFSYYLLTLL